MFAQRHRARPAAASAGLGVALLLVLLAAGCAAPSWPAQPESRVLDSPAQRDRAVAAPAPPPQPWYADRRDRQPTVVVGPRAPVVERSVTLTADRQRIIRGQVRDHHRTTTYRREERAGVR